MKGRIAALIKEYCIANGIDIPSGFDRHPAGRYAIVITEHEPHKLVARTWSLMEDIVYYIQNLSSQRETASTATPGIRIFDFKEGIELHYTGGKRLQRGKPIESSANKAL